MSSFRPSDSSPFLAKYNLPEGALSRIKTKWETLLEIFDHHSDNFSKLLTPANYVVEQLQQIPQVHSIKRRIKDPEHLVEKIIRKSLAKPSLTFDISSYREQITDLVGIRVLHLFKEDWSHIHDFIRQAWSLAEKPIANIRKGDSASVSTEFRKCGCRVEEHPHGYRSVHYLIKVPHGKSKIVAEVQARTVFEEGWSEIDHRIRYPYEASNPLLSQYLVIFNRLAGASDEMGSFISLLRTELSNMKQQKEVLESEKETATNELEKSIAKLKITEAERQDLQTKLKAATTSVHLASPTSPLSPMMRDLMMNVAKIQAAMVVPPSKKKT